MGFYINIKDDAGYLLLEKKYGVGFPLLMFAKNPMSENKVILTEDNVFHAQGYDAIKNLQEVIAYIDNYPIKRNADKINRVKEELMGIITRLKADRTYFCDYSEAMKIVDNPKYSVEEHIFELADNLEDMLMGYAEFGSMDKDDVSSTALQFLDSLSNDIYVSIIWKSNKNFVVFGVNVCLTEKDKELIEKGSPVIGSGLFYNTFMIRKIYRTFIKSGFEFEICKANAENNYYLIVDRKSLEDWFATTPYVECSYRTKTTYDIRYQVKNTPENLEKFICFAKESGGKTLESIVVGGKEITKLSNDEVSKVVGKHFIEHIVDKNSIDMAYIG